jgi:hypothetical protein
MDENNATALHKISVMAENLDAGATATASFIEDYGWYVLISVFGCFALCLVSACYGYCKSIAHCCFDLCWCLCWCLSCRCCRGRSEHSRLRDDEV